MADEIDFSGADAITTQTPTSNAPVTVPVDSNENNILSKEDEQAILREVEMERKYGDAPIEAAALAAAGTATFSLTDRALQKLGIYSKEELREKQARSPLATTLGTIGGIVIPSVFTGGASGAAVGGAKGAAMGAARAAAAPVSGILKTAAGAEKLLASALAKSSSKVLAKNIIKDSLEKAAVKGVGGAIEGAGFGVGQLLREDALGDAELNGENLFAAAGTGALWGLVGGAALPVIGAGAKMAGKQVGNVFEKVVSKYADPIKASEEITGLPVSKIVKLKDTKAGSELLEDLPRWYVEDVGITFSDAGKASKIAEKVYTLKKKAGVLTTSLPTMADDLAATRMPLKAGGPAFKQEILNEVATDIETRFYTPNKDFKSLAGQNRKIKNLIDDLRMQAKTSEGGTGAVLLNAKRRMDDIASAFHSGGIGRKATLSDTAAIEARHVLDRSINRYVTFVDEGLGKQLSKANRDYHYAKTVGVSLAKKAATDKSFDLSFKDALFGLMGYGVGNVYGLVGLAGKKFLESDLRRNLAIMTGIKKTAEKTAARTKQAMNSFFTATARPTRLAVTSALIGSPLASMSKDNKRHAAKNKKEAFKNISENLIEFNANPEKLMNHTIKAGAAISSAAPNTATVVGERLVGAVQFLNSKIPKRPYEAELPGMKPKPYEPSSMELAKFERYLQVVDNPLSILEDFESNTLTREHVEALKVVYPSMYTAIRNAAYDKMREDSDKPLSYQKRVQMSILLNLEGDSSLLGKNIMALQENFKTTEHAEGGATPIVKATQGGAENLDMSSRAAGANEAFARRRNQS